MIYVFLANGFEEVEALTPVDVLRRLGCEVKTVGVGGREITGSHGVTVKADLEEKDVVSDGVEMVVLPGGMPGTLNLEKSPIVRAAVEAAAKDGVWVAAICAAPSVLGHLGLLKGRTATCYPGFEPKMGSAVMQSCGAVRDGTVITGRAAGSSEEFGLLLLEALKGKAAAEKVAGEIVYSR